MPEFVTIAKVGQIPAGQGRCFSAGSHRIAVFYVDGQYYGLDDFCPHAGSPLHSGEIQQGMVICDRHRWAFHLESGICADAPTLRAKTFAIRVVGDEIQVEMP
jgi:nitrite reductase (NADH) small subunit/3-phenylpropionate/trans-cinnamate dioxygenase ferredoxin subunit